MMSKIVYWGALSGLLGTLTVPVQARGRRPDPEDGYPDYNRLEMRKKMPDIPAEKPPPPPPAPRPSLNVPLNSAASQDDVPKPPPPAIPLQDSSEPALPEDMMNTLVPSATAQSPNPTPK